jgi:adenylate cyclase
MQQLSLFSEYPSARPLRSRRKLRSHSETMHWDLWSQENEVEKEMALFFLDIRNFTPFVEKHHATDVVHIVRKVFSRFQHIIRIHHGRIIETTGDGLYAAFGFNGSVTEAVNAAVQAGGAILQALEKLNKQSFEKNLHQRLEVGIGVHVGKVATGNLQLGANSHFIVMGHAVNVASRLQATTKALNNNFIISSKVYEMLNNMPKRDPIKVNLKGMRDAVEVHFMGTAYEA